MASNDTITASVPLRILETAEFTAWLDETGGTDLVRMEAAIAKILSDGVITNAKSLGEGLHEKKWVSGLRMYFAIAIGDEGNITVLLLASGKGIAQSRTIVMCRELLSDYDVYTGNIAKRT